MYELLSIVAIQSSRDKSTQGSYSSEESSSQKKNANN